MKRGDDTEFEEDVIEAEVETARRIHQRRIKLQNGTEMIIRNVPACVKVPYFLESKDSESFYYSLLLQYLPHRDESELLGEYESAALAFKAHDNRKNESSNIMNEFRKRDRQLEKCINSSSRTRSV